MAKQPPFVFHLGKKDIKNPRIYRCEVFFGGNEVA